MDQLDLDFTAEFPVLEHCTFLNHAGTSPICARAALAMCDYARQSSTRSYVDGNWYGRVQQVRKSAAKLIHAREPHEIAFIPNTSTGLSLVAKGLSWRPGDQVVITDVEYPANRYPWEDLKRLGVQIIEVPQQPDGRIPAELVADAVTNRTRIVSISHVQYASGYRVDLRQISDMVHQVNGYLCVDAIQSVGACPVDVQAMGIDFLSADGHKWMLAPEGAGIFYCHEDLCPSLHPNIVGWMNMVDPMDFGNYHFAFQPDAHRFEPGTLNVPGILSLGASIDLLIEAGMETVHARIDALTTRLCQGLADAGYTLFSPRGEGERSGIIVFEPRNGRSPDDVVNRCMQADIIIVNRGGRLRASPHFYNQNQQIDRLVDVLKSL